MAVLKTSSVFILRITAGRLFHSIGAADWNARSPSVDRYLLLGGTSNSPSLDLKEYLNWLLAVISLIK